MLTLGFSIQSVIPFFIARKGRLPIWISNDDDSGDEMIDSVTDATGDFVCPTKYFRLSLLTNSPSYHLTKDMKLWCK